MDNSGANIGAVQGFTRFDTSGYNFKRDANINDKDGNPISGASCTRYAASCEDRGLRVRLPRASLSR